MANSCDCKPHSFNLFYQTDQAASHALEENQNLIHLGTTEDVENNSEQNKAARRFAAQQVRNGILADLNIVCCIALLETDSEFAKRCPNFSSAEHACCDDGNVFETRHADVS